MAKRRFKITFTQTETKHGVIHMEHDYSDPAEVPQEIIEAFSDQDYDSLAQIGSGRIEWEIDDILFDPEENCPKCGAAVGPSSDSPTPDAYCSLTCAIDDGAVSEV